MLESYEELLFTQHSDILSNISEMVDLDITVDIVSKAISSIKS